jgi:hypothetical protein
MVFDLSYAIHYCCVPRSDVEEGLPPLIPRSAGVRDFMNSSVLNSLSAYFNRPDHVDLVGIL